MEKSIRSVIGIIMATVMAVIIGATAIVGINTVNDINYGSSIQYREAAGSMAKILEYIQQLKALPYMAIEAELEEQNKSIPVLQYGIERVKYFEEYSYWFDATIINPEVRSSFDELKDVYYNGYMPLLHDMLNRAYDGADANELRQYVAQMTDAANHMAANAEMCMDFSLAYAEESADAGDAAARTMTMIIIILLVIEIILSVVFIIVSIAADRSPKPVSVATPVANGKFPVYAMYPADPSNPASPPNATHVLYPIIHPFTPDEPRN